MAIEDILYKHYNDMFDELIKEIGDDLYDFSIEVKTEEGYSIKKSWIDRNERLGGTVDK